MRIKSSILIIVLVIVFGFSGQVKIQGQSVPLKHKFRAPMNIELFLSGNFAEVRSNHFHSGIDIKTNGQTGEPVMAAETGYISRIKVEPGGYGKAIYLTHPNGYTTVYGHLREFDKKIADYVRQQQYKRKSFRVDLFPKAGSLSYEKGEVIALSGNSGSSQGPHLHFEIRDTQTENPLNPLLFPFNITDNRPPIIYRVNLYSLKGRKSLKKPDVYKAYGSEGKYRLSPRQAIPVDTIFGVGIETIDFLNGSSNKCGVYSIKMYVDMELYFNSETDEFSFAESRYINSFVDYAEYRNNRSSLYKTFIDPNNNLSVLQFSKNKGVVDLEDNEPHTISMEIRDVAGNLSTLNFKIKRDTTQHFSQPEQSPLYNAYFPYAEVNNFEEENIKISIPSKALYKNLYFNYESDEAPEKAYSRLHKIHNPDVPVHKSFKISIKPETLPEELKKYALIARVEKNYNASIGGKWENGYLVSSTRSFGNYTIMIDSVPPKIKPRNFKTGSDLVRASQIRFTISDNFSGVSQYKGEIDGKWVLFEYDSKNQLIFHDLTKDPLDRSVPHKLYLEVKDGIGNISKYSTEIK